MPTAELAAAVNMRSKDRILEAEGWVLTTRYYPPAYAPEEVAADWAEGRKENTTFDEHGAKISAAEWVREL